jgi:hypothetical protein
VRVAIAVLIIMYDCVTREVGAIYGVFRNRVAVNLRHGYIDLKTAITILHVGSTFGTLRPFM